MHFQTCPAILTSCTQNYHSNQTSNVIRKDSDAYALAFHPLFPMDDIPRSVRFYLSDDGLSACGLWFLKQRKQSASLFRCRTKAGHRITQVYCVYIGTTFKSYGWPLYIYLFLKKKKNRQSDLADIFPNSHLFSMCRELISDLEDWCRYLCKWVSKGPSQSI